MKTTTELCVTDFMTRDVVAVEKETNLTEAIQIMDLKSLSAVPVVDQQGFVCGMLSTSDLISLTYQLQCDVTVLPHVSAAVRESFATMLAEDNESLKVTDAMTADVATISWQENLGTAARKFLDNACHHLPVIDESNRPIGILSTTDIIKALADQESQ